MDTGTVIATLCGIGSGALCLVLPGLIAAGHQSKMATNQAIDPFSTVATNAQVDHGREHSLQHLGLH